MAGFCDKAVLSGPGARRARGARPGPTPVGQTDMTPPVPRRHRQVDAGGHTSPPSLALAMPASRGPAGSPSLRVRKLPPPPTAPSATDLAGVAGLLLARVAPFDRDVQASVYKRWGLPVGLGYPLSRDHSRVRTADLRLLALARSSPVPPVLVRELQQGGDSLLLRALARLYRLPRPEFVALGRPVTAPGPVDLASLTEQYLRGLPLPEIAAGAGLSRDQVHSRLRAAGVPPRGRFVFDRVLTAAMLTDRLGDGLNARQIAAEVGCCTDTVRSALVRHGLRSRRAAPDTDRRAALARLAARYEGGLTLRELAVEEGRSQTTVRRWLLSAGVTLRPPGPAPG